MTPDTQKQVLEALWEIRMIADGRRRAEEGAGAAHPVGECAAQLAHHEKTEEPR